MRTIVLSVFAGMLLAAMPMTTSAQGIFGSIPAKSEKALRGSNAMFMKIEKKNAEHKELFAQWDDAVEKEVLALRPDIEDEISALENQKIKFQNGGYGYPAGEYRIADVSVDAVQYPFFTQKKSSINKSGCHVVGDYNPIGVVINISVWAEGVPKNIIGMKHAYCLVVDDEGTVVDCGDAWLGKERNADESMTRGALVLKSPESPVLAERYKQLVFVDQTTYKEWLPKVEALQKAAADDYFRK